MSEKKAMERGEIYDKLTPQRRMLVDMILQNLENGAGLWKKGWRCGGAPENAVTGKKYRGVNNMFLTYISMLRGYRDNRWLTFNQMKEREWSFKTDAEGNSLGKRAGVSVEFFELWDRETKKKFDRSILDGMSLDERQEYIDENVYPIRKYYTVFNGDLIAGIPEKETVVLDESAKSERMDKFLDYWSENEAKIVYGGEEAFYSPLWDEVHLPPREDFYSLQEFYSTSMHEVGHSTGHKKRLNRKLNTDKKSDEYAIEELRVETASLFIEQDFGIYVNKDEVRNNSAYIQSWKNAIKNDPNVLFTAIADAEKIAKYIQEKESDMTKEVEPYAITEDENENGEKVYQIQMIAAYGQTRVAPLGAYADRESLMKEFEKMQKLPFWTDKRFKEVSMDELEAESIRRAEAEEKAEQEPIAEEPSKVYMLPSVAAAIEAGNYIEEAKPKARVISEESYVRMIDRELFERIQRSKGGEKFTQLYNGISVTGNEEKDEYSLMTRLAIFTDDDEQMMRMFCSSAQFRDKKPLAHYEKLKNNALAFVQKMRENVSAASIGGAGRVHAGVNAK